MLTVACVKWGNKYDARYVKILADMVARCYSSEYRFVCFTDDPAGLDGIETRPLPGNMAGWWNKLYLFAPGVLTGRVLYLDLDVLVVGDLHDIVEFPASFGIIKDWWQPCYNSSVMVWDAERHHDVWIDYTDSVAQRLQGDQDWITEQKQDALTFPEDWCVSFKEHCASSPPRGAKIIVFHGDPKPHEVGLPWVQEVWKIGGAAAVEFTSRCNTASEIVARNIDYSVRLGLPTMSTSLPANKNEMILCGGGPSLEKSLGQIRYRAMQGAHVWATNGTYKWLYDHGVDSDYFVMADARPENISFVSCPLGRTRHFIASQCDPDVFDTLCSKGLDVVLWHAHSTEAQAAMASRPYEPCMLVGGGATVGMKALYMGYLAGYRKFRLFGMDSCYFASAHHAYPQAQNDGEETFRVVCGSRTFNCSPWQINQAQDFQRQARELVNRGCRIVVHGEGLLAAVLNSEEDGNV